MKEYNHVLLTLLPPLPGITGVQPYAQLERKSLDNFKDFVCFHLYYQIGFITSPSFRYGSKHWNRLSVENVPAGDPLAKQVDKQSRV